MLNTCLLCYPKQFLLSSVFEWMGTGSKLGGKKKKSIWERCFLMSLSLKNCEYTYIHMCIHMNMYVFILKYIYRCVYIGLAKKFVQIFPLSYRKTFWPIKYCWWYAVQERGLPLFASNSLVQYLIIVLNNLIDVY